MQSDFLTQLTKNDCDAVYRQDLYSFAARAFNVLEPAFEFEYNWHLDCIAEHLIASYKGEITRLIINVPPRCLKSVMVAQIFPAWVLGKEPHQQFIGASYVHSLAERNVMATRRLLQSDWYRGVFPNTLISPDQNKKDHFSTTQAGQYKGTGIGGSIMGVGCNYLIIDDPISPKEGNSPTVRATANMEIRQTLFSRFNDKRTGKLVMIMQRIHEDDPTGNLMEDGGYYLLKLPAETKTSIVITLNNRKWEMKAGELLTPRLPRSALDELRIDLQESGYTGQYLQEPIPVGGGEFKPQYLQYYDPRTKTKYGNIYILCDAAGGDEVNKKKKKTSDWTAFAVVELASDNNYYLLDMIRDRLNATERVETLFLLHRKWNDLTGNPPKVGYEKYGLMTDTHYIKVKQDIDNYRFPVIELAGRVMKEERIRRIIPDIERGRWYLPNSLFYVDTEGRRFDLIKELVDGEMKSFPKARFDDMLDAISRIVDEELGAVFPQIKSNNYFPKEKRTESWIDW